MRDYQNHARRHAPGGSDPIVQSSDWASGSIPSTTVTTPWTMNNTVVAFNSFSAGGTLFSQDSSSRGIEVADDCRARVATNMRFQGSGGHTVPTGIRIIIVQFNPGSPPSTSWTGASELLVREHFITGGIDNNFPDAHVYIESEGSEVPLDGGFSYGVHLEAVGATGDWKYVGRFAITEQHITYS